MTEKSQDAGNSTAQGAARSGGYGGLPPSTKKDSLWMLKISVYAMGVMLLGGFLWLGGRLAVKAGEMNSASCREITLNAPRKGITALEYAGEHWVVHYGTYHALRFDRCGRQVQEVQIGK